MENSEVDLEPFKYKTGKFQPFLIVPEFLQFEKVVEPCVRFRHFATLHSGRNGVLCDRVEHSLHLGTFREKSKRTSPVASLTSRATYLIEGKSRR